MEALGQGLSNLMDAQVLAAIVIGAIGGLAIGMAQHDLAFSQALENYTLLTIGDGLVAQIPSLLLSTSAAIIVTRVNNEQDMGQQIMQQMFAEPKALAIAAGILIVMGLIRLSTYSLVYLDMFVYVTV